MNFSYSAQSKDGKTVSGEMEAQNRDGVVKSLEKKGLHPISINEVTAGSQSKGALSFLQSGKVKSDDLVMFTRQLSAMVSAGVPLLRALSSLEAHTESAALKKISGSLLKDVQSGIPLGDALAKHPAVFNDIYINMVRAGEAAGILDDILKRLATQQEKASSMKKKIKSAMTYPMVLIAITILAFFGLMIFVIPQIAKILQDLGGPDAQLPVLTQAMLAISAAIIQFWYIVLIGLVALVFSVRRYIKTPQGKHAFHSVVLKLPGVKTIVSKVAVARFARTFSALIGAGVSVLEALSVTARALGNALYEEAIVDATERVKNGEQLSKIIEENKLFPPIVAQMLAVGEETGETDTALVKIADFYEEEVDVAIEGISSIIEPVMIVFMGGMVGVIAASVMQPIAELSSNIKA